jgi:hypothetical protein
LFFFNYRRMKKQPFINIHHPVFAATSITISISLLILRHEGVREEVVPRSSFG